MNAPLTPVILCGGSGTRLWPLSRKAFPKQFVPMIEGKILLLAGGCLLECRRVLGAGARSSARWSNTLPTSSRPVDWPRSGKPATGASRRDRDNLPQAREHRHCARPWGLYDCVDSGVRFKVKRITVKPGGKFSLKTHQRRAEHWIVVTGIARVTQGGETFLIEEDESTYIPLGMVHRLENPGEKPLEMIEVQSGDYLGEGDTLRFEDQYGRR